LLARAEPRQALRSATTCARDGGSCPRPRRGPNAPGFRGDAPPQRARAQPLAFTAPYLTHASHPTPEPPAPTRADNGNGTFAATNGTRPPAATNWAGRFSNGPVWADYLSGRPFERVINLAHAGASACPGAGAGPGPGPGAPGGGGGGGGAAAWPAGGGGAAGPMGPPPLSVLNQTQRYLEGPGAPAAQRAAGGGAPRVVALWIGAGGGRGARARRWGSGANGCGPGPGEGLAPLEQRLTPHGRGPWPTVVGPGPLLPPHPPPPPLATPAGGNDIMQAPLQPAAARGAALDRTAACVEASLRALLEAGEARIVVGTPTVFGIGGMAPADRVGRWRRRYGGRGGRGGVCSRPRGRGPLSSAAAGGTKVTGAPTPPRPRPRARHRQALALEASAEAAAKLRPALARLRAAHPGARIEVWDAAGLVANLTAGPAAAAAAGLANTRAPCLTEAAARGAPRLGRPPPAAGGGGGARRRRLRRLATAAPGAAARAAAPGAAAARLAAAAAALARARPAGAPIPAPHCADPDSYLYWDGAHPTTAGHLLVARDFLAFLQRARLLE
jgi:hypothetical protein